MPSFSRASLTLLAAAAAAAALLAAPASAQGTTTCGLCGAGETLNAEKPLFSPPGADPGALPTSCGGFDDTLAVIPVEACDSTIEDLDFLSPIDFRVYCECSGVDAPGVCDMCGASGGSLIAAADEPSDLLNGYTCRQFNDLLASIVETEECQQASAAAELCCEGGTIGTNTTTGDDDAADDDDNGGTNSTIDGAICPICADGSDPTSDTIIPTINLTCSSFATEPIPDTACASLTGSIAVGALCGCPGETAPLTCPLCGGAAVPEENAGLVVSIAGGSASLTCAEGQLFAQYAGDALCATAVPELDAACCGAASDAPSLAPSFPGTATDFPTATPSAGTGTGTPTLVSTFEPSAPPTASGAAATARAAAAALAASALAALAALA